MTMQDVPEPGLGEAAAGGLDEWRPAEEVTTHAGDPIAAEAEFFHAPPESIGEVVSAFTSLTRRTRPTSWRKAVTWALIVAAVLVGLMEVLKRVVGPMRASQQHVAWLFIAVVSLIVFVIAWAVTRFRHRCTYVGTQGLARYRLRGSRTSAPQEEIFLFDAASYVKTAETRQYVNGVYSGTIYNYSWQDEGGTKLFELRGTCRANKKPPKPTDPYHFAVAAEAAWSQYRIAGLADEVEQEGYIRFPILDRGGRVRAVHVGAGFVAFESKDGCEQIETGEFSEVQIKEGTFTFKMPDAKWFSGKGKFSFSYGSLGNAQLFMYCLEQVAGISFEG